MNLRFVLGDFDEGSTGEEEVDGACVRATRRCLRVRALAPLESILTLQLEDLTWSSCSSAAGNPAREFPFLDTDKMLHIAPFERTVATTTTT